MQIVTRIMSTEQMVTEEDYLKVKDAVKAVKRNLIIPDTKALIVLYQFYKRLKPSQAICFTCGHDRAKVLKYCKKFIETWQTNQ